MTKRPAQPTITLHPEGLEHPYRRSAEKRQPSPAQLAYLDRLCDTLGRRHERPDTQADASDRIAVLRALIAMR